MNQKSSDSPPNGINYSQHENTQGSTKLITHETNVQFQHDIQDDKVCRCILQDQMVNIWNYWSFL